MRYSTAAWTRSGSWPSTAMTGPRAGGIPSRNEGRRGGEILARTLILLRNGIVMTVASTLEPSCG